MWLPMPTLSAAISKLTDLKITEIINDGNHDPTSKSNDFSSSRLLRTSASFIWSRENPSSPKFFANFRNTSAYNHMRDQPANIHLKNKIHFKN